MTLMRRLGLILSATIALLFILNACGPVKYDTFAKCVADSGATFYGAYWCPHCATQKGLFKNSKEIPYVECSLPNRAGETEICREMNIETYPTWILADGERLVGVQQLTVLAQRTGCEIPE